MQKIPAIKSVMTPSPLSVAIDEPVGVAEDMMIDHGIRHLLATDACRCFADFLESHFPRAKDDTSS